MTTELEEIAPINNLFDALEALETHPWSSVVQAELCQKIGSDDEWEVLHWFEHNAPPRRGKAPSCTSAYPITIEIVSTLRDGGYVKVKQPSPSHAPTVLCLTEFGKQRFKDHSTAEAILRADDTLKDVPNDFVMDVVQKFDSLKTELYPTDDGFKIKLTIYTERAGEHWYRSLAIHETESSAMDFATKLLWAIRTKGLAYNIDLPEDSESLFDPVVFDKKVDGALDLLWSSFDEPRD